MLPVERKSVEAWRKKPWRFMVPTISPTGKLPAAADTVAMAHQVRGSGCLSVFTITVSTRVFVITSVS